MPSALTNTLLFALVGQLLPAAVFVPLQTEKYYDLCGTLGFLSTTAFALYQTPTPKAVVQDQLKGSGSLLGRAISVFRSTKSHALTRPPPPPQQLLLDRHARQWIASACVAVWAVRLGSYLFGRIHKTGRDPRFDTIRSNPLTFTFAWTMQAVWIGLTALPVFLINTLPAHSHPAIGGTDVIAALIWATGFVLEAVADRTKSQWRREREDGAHKEGFVRRGVWSWCRHPNYFGEITLWTGLAVLASATTVRQASTALSAPHVWLPFLSPLFEYALIRHLSGVPMLRRQMDEKLKDDAEYKAYKSKTPCFVPFVGSTE